jgi:hypothetical protein
MRSALSIALLLLLTACGTAMRTADPLSDAPEGPRPVLAFTDAPSYPQALRAWRSPEDVNGWIGARFQYDMARAMQLSETQRSRAGAVPIHAPQDFFAAPAGICVDLSRFAVETLRQVDATLKPAYLMIEFAPARVAGNTLRMHWVATFRRDGQLYVFADSKRPGHIAGPYASAQEFVTQYAAWRQRSVVAFSERATYQRQQRTMAVRQSRPQRAP